MKLRLALLAFATLLLSAVSRATEPPPLEPGKKIFEREGCPMCHSIGGAGNRRNPLDGVGKRLDAARIRTWILAPQEIRPGIAKKGYKLSEPDLDALVRYLGSL